jgi:hypothetical protein
MAFLQKDDLSSPNSDPLRLSFEFPASFRQLPRWNQNLEIVAFWFLQQLTQEFSLHARRQHNVFAFCQNPLYATSAQKVVACNTARALDHALSHFPMLTQATQPRSLETPGPLTDGLSLFERAHEGTVDLGLHIR